MEDYSERNLHIIEEIMQELGISDCEEIPAAIRLLKQQSRPTKRAGDKSQPPPLKAKLRVALAPNANRWADAPPEGR